MTAEVLFQITTDKLETGLRGFPVGYCTTSAVDPYKGLSYRGKLISELGLKRPEEVIYLLVQGKEGTASEVSGYFSQKCVLKKEVIEAIERLPRKGHPMKLFAAALLIAGMFEQGNSYREDCDKLIMLIPHITAVVINHHAGWGKTAKPRPDLGYMENFVHLLNVPDKKEEELTAAFRLFNVLHYDHGGGNLSTFVGKAVASGLEDMYGSTTSALCALAGPRHGRANQDCLEFLREIITDLGESPSVKDVEAALRKRLEEKRLIFGFGHAVLRVEDPRATLVYNYVGKRYPSHPLVKVAFALREAGVKVLKENPKISNPYPNIDAISGTLLVTAGFDYAEYFTLLFGLSRVVGIARQIVYEREEARGGKGTPLVRPKYFYESLGSSS